MTRRLGAALFTALVLWGCAGQDQAIRSTDDGFFGTFRGRWWNYYERGVARMNEGRNEDAASDFREALRGRSRDAWSARTYGLHFEEYFPNRELGVLNYKLGNLEEARAALEKSLEDVDTARAHHFLDLVIKDQISQGLVEDNESPSLQAESGNTILAANWDVPIAIRASDDVGVAEVRLNGNRLYQRGSATELSFEDNVRLEEGEHVVQLDANDLADRTSSESVVVRVDVTAPTIAVFEPAPELVTEGAQVTLRGACVDNFGIAEVRMGDQVLASGDGGDVRLDFQTPLQLSAGENSFPLIVVDDAGNVNSTTVRVFQGGQASREAKLWWIKHRAPERLRTASTAESLAAVLSTAYTAAGDNIDIELSFPEVTSPDQVYSRNEIPVKGRVIAQTQLASLMVNERSLPLVDDPLAGQGEVSQTFDTRVALNRGPNDIPVSARDAAGNQAEERLQVQADFVTTETDESKMPIAVLTMSRQLPDNSLEDNEILRIELQQQILEQDRFNLVERAQLETVLTEQQLASAIGDPDYALRLGAVVPAHAYIVGVSQERGSGLDIKLQVVATETTKLVAIVDTYVEDASDTAAVEAGLAELAEQLRQKYPRLTGELLTAADTTVAANYTREDGVFEGMSILVLQENQDGLVDEQTGEIIIEPTVRIIGRATITQVTDRAVRGERVSGEDPLEKGMPTITW